MQFSVTYHSIFDELEFIDEVIRYGVTQLGKANFTNRGMYFQAFSNLSIGIERIGKICIFTDHYINNGSEFPDKKEMKKIGHNLNNIYQKCFKIKENCSFKFQFLNQFESIHITLLDILCRFAQSDRYANLDFLATGLEKEPIKLWSEKIDQKILDNYVSSHKKNKILAFSQAPNSLNSCIYVDHIDENRDIINNPSNFCRKNMEWQAIAPYRRLLALQVFRFFMELYFYLSRQATSPCDIPISNELFADFRNPDNYIKKRKSWLKH